MRVPCKNCGALIEKNAATCPACRRVTQVNEPDVLPRTPVAAMAVGDRIVITGVDIPFGELIALILKVMLACGIASIIMIMVVGVIEGIFGVALGGLLRGILR